MPVIREEPTVALTTPEDRARVLAQLVKELAGENTPAGPVIFEIPIQKTSKFDAFVVWDAWQPFDSEDRSNIILEAYQDRKDKVAQSLGVTIQEAREEFLLPYEIGLSPGNPPNEETNSAKIAEGGFKLPNGDVVLQFPTASLQKRALDRLRKNLPEYGWIPYYAPGPSF